MWRHGRIYRLLNIRRYADKSSKIKYQRMSPLEHVLLRPGMYVGAVNPSTTTTWIYDAKIHKMEKRNLYYTPAFVKIFDEILVNAADNRLRGSSMTYIDVNIGNDEKGNFCISVKNDGEIVPLTIDTTEQLYVPELILGHLMTGSNFDDSEGRVTGGTHGLGAKLTNIFSTAFEVKIYDASSQTLYHQQWRDNMRVVSPPILQTLANDETQQNYTQITFYPDMVRLHTAPTAHGEGAAAMVPAFGLADNLSKVDGDGDVLASLDDVVAVMCRRVVDMCSVNFSSDSDTAATPIAVFLNGSRLRVNNMLDYMALFPLDSAQTKVITVRDRWIVGVAQSPSGFFEHMSFVNGVWTMRGGTHVNHVASQCVKYLNSLLEKIHGPTEALGPGAAKNQLMLFIQCLIENPSFDSQSKDMLTTYASKFGSTCPLPSSFLKTCFDDSAIIASLLKELKDGERARALKPTKGQFGRNSIDVKGLQDAHSAGVSGKSSDCTLIITEGESAKALAVAGLEVVGREKYGVLAIRGKLLNVSNKRKNAFKSKEIISLCQAMGLHHSKQYENDSDMGTLRYGHILLMTDQDADGSHIKALVINVLHTFWPSLLRRENFVQQLHTPIVKVFREKRGHGQNTNIVKEFYTNSEYDEWVREQERSVETRKLLNTYTVKYYKGLGTSTAEEGRAYFKDLARNVKSFVMGPGTGESLDMLFGPDRVDDRKKWLRSRSGLEELANAEQKYISYESFVNKDMIEFSFANVFRSLPNVVDGLKPTQRKVLYTCLSKNITSDVKVMQLAGAVTELTAYHHGETSLIGTIMKMAGDFVGANNIPLLVPSGQFGTRHQGGEDAANPRYVFTRLSEVSRLIYPKVDNALLKHIQEDGKEVEPSHFLPVIPMLLVNGSFGVGTGWSTSIPMFHPMEVLQCVRDNIRGVPSKKLMPWLRGFQGDVWSDGSNFASRGVLRRKSNREVEISELPFYRWTDSYKSLIIQKVQKGKLVVTGMKEDHTVNGVKFLLSAPSDQWDSLELKYGDLRKALLLYENINTGNMHAFDASLNLVKYHSAEEILQAHYTERLEGYRARKVHLLDTLKQEYTIASNKAKFVSAILRGEIELTSGGRLHSTEYLVNALHRCGYDLVDDGSGDPSFKYMLSLPIESLTVEKFQELQGNATTLGENLETLRQTSPEDMWERDLDVLEKELARDPLLAPRQSESNLN